MGFKPTPSNLSGNNRFSSLREESEPLQTYGLPESARVRLGEIVHQMAAVTGGASYPAIEVTGKDEIGLLEQLLSEAILNARFAREALLEHGGLSGGWANAPPNWKTRSPNENGLRKRLRLNESRLETCCNSTR